MRKKVIPLIVFILLSSAVYSEIGLEARALASAGFTIADIETASGEEGVTLEDWGQFYWSIHAQVLYKLNETMKVGGEIGYQYLFWYSYTYPYPPYTVYRGNDVAPFNISGVFEYKLNDAMAIMGGPGVYIYGNGAVFGLFAAFSYSWKITENISIPAFARLDAIFATGFTVPISLGGGIKYSF